MAAHCIETIFKEGLWKAEQNSSVMQFTRY